MEGMKRNWWGAMLLTAFVCAIVPMVPSRADAQGICNARNCPAGQERVRLECKTCKVNKRRPAIELCRAVCQKPNGKIKPKKYPKCPKKSPSAGCTN